jgi:hypothetical protein
MQKIVDELKSLITFKNTTDIGDIILVVAKEPQMLIYAYVNDIERDTSRKDEWWHVSFTMLTLPLQKTTWTLRTAQMTGKDIFTMGGEERFIQAINFGPKNKPEGISQHQKKVFKHAGLKQIK